MFANISEHEEVCLTSGVLHSWPLASVPSPGQISVSECRTADRKYATLLTFTPGHHPAQGTGGQTYAVLKPLSCVHGVWSQGQLQLGR